MTRPLVSVCKEAVPCPHFLMEHPLLQPPSARFSRTRAFFLNHRKVWFCDLAGGKSPASPAEGHCCPIPTKSDTLIQRLRDSALRVSQASLRALRLQLRMRREYLSITTAR